MNPTVSFKNNKSLKDHLVRSALPMPGKDEGPCKYHGNPYQICNFIKETSSFCRSVTNETFKIKS